MIVTHEVDIARKTASKVVYMENGRIVEQGGAQSLSRRRQRHLPVICHTDYFLPLNIKNRMLL